MHLWQKSRNGQKLLCEIKWKMRKLVDENAAFFFRFTEWKYWSMQPFTSAKFLHLRFLDISSYHDNPRYNEQFQTPGLRLSINDSYVKHIWITSRTNLPTDLLHWRKDQESIELVLEFDSSCSFSHQWLTEIKTYRVPYDFCSDPSMKWS